MPTIRHANPSDAKTLMQAEQHYAQTPGYLVSNPHELNEEMFAKKIKALGSGEGIYIVAEQNGQIVGHALMDQMGLENLAHIYRLTIVVHPNMTSKGIGKALMNHLISWAKENPKALKIELLVRSSNSRAISLYKKMGFTEEGRIKNRIRISPTEFIDDIMMGLWLKPDSQTDSKKSHWENVYSTKADEQLSWTQSSPAISLEWILESSPARDAKVIDIGGGISELTDSLLQEKFMRPTVLDISGAALDRAKARLGQKASLVQWIESDITKFETKETFSFWHDRAVFHFLVKPEDRRKYVDTLTHALVPGGFALIATFATDGPSKCSGLEVMRYDEKGLSQELGSAFQLIKSCRYTHTTPWGSEQNFVFCLFKKVVE